MHTLLQDLRYGIRTLARKPSFTLVALFTLMLGIGATTAIFTIVDAVLLRPLPFTNPDRLVEIWNSAPQQKISYPGLTFDTLDQWRTGADFLDGFEGYQPVSLTLTGAPEPKLVQGTYVMRRIDGVSITREKELAVRAALGAGRGRILRQLLTESVLLSVSGGSLGVLLASWGVSVIAHSIPREINFFSTNPVSLDHRVLFFSLGVSGLTGVLFGLLPSLKASRINLNDSLAAGGRSNPAPWRRAVFATS
jgi:hypothetical protein